MPKLKEKPIKLFEAKNILKSKLNLFFVPFLFFILVLNGFMVPTQAEIFIQPKSDDKKENFFFRLKPGESKSDEFTISNPSGEQAIIDLTVKDTVKTSDNNLTLRDNKEPDNAVGSWLTILNKTLSVKGSSQNTLNFSLKVPEATKSGEYVGGIAATEQLPTNTKGAVSRVRKTIRVYIFVEGEDEKQSSEISNAKILSTKSDNYQELREQYPLFGLKNLTFEVPALNTGNTYSNINIEYTLYLPDGKKTQGNKNFVLTPRDTTQQLAIFSSQPYEVGKTRVELNWEITPYNPELNSKLEPLKGSSQTTIELNQSDLDKFLPATLNPSLQEKQTPTTFNEEEIKSNLFSLKNLLIVLALTFTITSLVLVIIFLILKDKKYLKP